MTWGSNYFGLIVDKHYVPGTWFTALEFNHSLSGFFKRLLPAVIVRPIWLIISTVFLSCAAFTILRVRAVEKSLLPGVERFELGCILCLMLLLSPASSKPHFCVLLLPAWAIAREALIRRDRFLLGATAFSIVAGLVANKDLVGATIYDAAKWWGVITLETVVLFGACLWAHCRAVQRTRGST